MSLARQNIFLFVFILIFTYAQSDVLNRFDPREINDPCNSGSGTYKLESDCSSKGLNREGFLIGYGAIVCCPSVTVVKPTTTARPTRRTGVAARAYCKKFGWSTSLLGYHIVDGESAEEGEYPNMVAIFKQDALGVQTLICGGSLISEKFILTAAHCFNVDPSNKIFVRMGRTSLDLADNADQSVAVERMIDLKKVKKPQGYTRKEKYDDIALIELDSPVIFTEKIQPICLDVADDSDENRNFTIIGYGQTEASKSSSGSNWLQKAQVKDSGHHHCSKKFNEVKEGYMYEMPRGVINTQLCALGLANSRGRIPDTCQGDSGGPLIHENRNASKYYLSGVTSFGIACGNEHFPSIYTRVSSYVDWIENIVWPQ